LGVASSVFLLLFTRHVKWFVGIAALLFGFGIGPLYRNLLRIPSSLGCYRWKSVDGRIMRLAETLGMASMPLGVGLMVQVQDVGRWEVLAWMTALGLGVALLLSLLLNITLLAVHRRRRQLNAGLINDTGTVTLSLSDSEDDDTPFGRTRRSEIVNPPVSRF